MSGITYLKGDATSPQAPGVTIIAHVCNDLGRWGKGFVVAISRRWAEPQVDFKRWYRERAANDFGLGAVRFVQVSPYTWVANMVGQRGIKTSRSKGVPVRYEAIEQALGAVAARAQALGASVHMPRIGCGLSGGTWDRIEPLIQGTLCAAGVDVYVYDYDV